MSNVQVSLRDYTRGTRNCRKADYNRPKKLIYLILEFFMLFLFILTSESRIRKKDPANSRISHTLRRREDSGQNKLQWKKNKIQKKKHWVCWKKWSDIMGWPWSILSHSRECQKPPEVLFWGGLGWDGKLKQASLTPNTLSSAIVGNTIFHTLKQSKTSSKTSILAFQKCKKLIFLLLSCTWLSIKI